MKMELILGPPGCGKTTELLSLVDHHIASGIDPDKIAFVSFTRKAADEAADRAVEKFGIKRDDLPWFRTIHSTAFRLLYLSSKNVLGKDDYKELCDEIGLTFTGDVSIDDQVLDSGPDGNRCIFMEMLARNMDVPLESLWNDSDGSIDWLVLQLYQRALSRYKSYSGLIDFTDMLENVLIQDANLSDIQVVIIDEAQDLSILQWRFIFQVFRSADQMYIAGDDDQAIFQWSGADTSFFLGLATRADTVRTLQQSYRLPKAIYDFANQISDHISTRLEKDWQPRDEPGIVEFHTSPDFLPIKKDESWLLLARNRFLLKHYEENLRMNGIPYAIKKRPVIRAMDIQAILSWEALRSGKSIEVHLARNVYNLIKGSGVKASWRQLPDIDDHLLVSFEDLALKYGLTLDQDTIWHDALNGISIEDREFYLAILRDGGKLTDPPKVFLDTIHGVKGGEADHVAIITDLAFRTWEELQVNEDPEHRVFYVAATRAKKSLHIIEPLSTKFYPLS